MRRPKLYHAEFAYLFSIALYLTASKSSMEQKQHPAVLSSPSSVSME
jgi:hypothetical protein